MTRGLPLALRLACCVLPPLLAAAGATACGRSPGAGSAGPGASAEAPRDAGAKLQAVEVGDDSLKTGIAPADAGLAARVRGKLAADPRLHGMALEVDAEGGRVTLWGKADDATAKGAAEQLARQTPGVTSVANLIETRGGKANPP